MLNIYIGLNDKGVYPKFKGAADLQQKPPLRTQFQMFSQHRYASFYLPIGRIWELLLGAFAAFYLRINDSTKYILYS